MAARRSTSKSNAKKSADGTGSVTFDTVLLAFGNNTGIEVPADVLEQLGAGKRPAVSVDVNGYVYRSTIATMSGKHLISVSAAIRKDTGLKAGDALHVTLTVETAPRTVDVPDDFAAALREAPPTLAFFEQLANSMQRYHVDQINTAKTDETRQRRIAKAVELFRAGKAR